MLTLRRILLPILALGAVFAVYRLRAVSGEAQALKFDLAEIDDIRYGLLDPDAWVDHVLVVIDRQIEELGEEPLEREQVQAVFEQVIRQLITEVETTMRRRNEEAPLGGLRQLATDFVVDFDDLRANSDRFAAIAVAELERPENRDRLKGFLGERMRTFADSTFARTDRRAFEAALARRGCDSRDACRPALIEALVERNATLFRTALVAIALVAAMILVAAWPRGRFGHVELGCVLVGVFALLIGGLFTPMIDIKAEITRLDLMLVGEPIVFENQVLFFQSKSIIDVVELLVRTGRLDLVLVGIGIGLFSVVFPTLKLLSTIAYRYGARLRAWRPVRFFALDSGKWSMADVFVVAMFLAFLGFDGLTGTQLAVLLTDSPFVDTATRNGTELRAGFHLFASFCLAGLILSGLVKRSLGRGSDGRVETAVDAG